MLVWDGRGELRAGILGSGVWDAAVVLRRGRGATVLFL